MVFVVNKYSNFVVFRTLLRLINKNDMKNIKIALLILAGILLSVGIICLVMSILGKGSYYLAVALGAIALGNVCTFYLNSIKKKEMQERKGTKKE